jgi:hypothetical protein
MSNFNERILFLKRIMFSQKEVQKKQKNLKEITYILGKDNSNTNVTVRHLGRLVRNDLAIVTKDLQDSESYVTQPTTNHCPNAPRAL